MTRLKFTLDNKMLVLCLVLLCFYGKGQNANSQTGTQLSGKQLNEVMGNPNTISFVENKGQWPANVIYKADVPGWQMLATPQGMLIGKFDPASMAAMSAYNAKAEDIMVRRARGQKVQNPGPAPAMKGHGWKLNFIGGSQATAQTILTNGKSADVMNYFSGTASGSNATGVHGYSEITYTDVYPGISVKYYTAAQGMENDIMVKPGANAHLINLQIEGIDNLKMNAKGDLMLPTSVGEVPISSPVSYLLDDKGNRTSISLKYRLTGKNTLSFEIPDYDKTQNLVIDPIVMRWATWVSGSTDQDGHCHGIDLDASGNIYVTGRIGTGLITVGAFQTTNPGSGDDMFIGMYTEPVVPGGAGTCVWQTYLGGTGTTNPYAIDIGPDGYVYVAGLVSDNLSTTYGTGAPSVSWTNRVPVIGNFGGQQCFVAKLPSSGAWATVRELGTISEDLGPTLFDLRVVPTGGNNFDLVAVGTVVQQSISGADGDIPAAQYPSGTVAATGGGNTNGYAFQISNDLSTLRWSKQYTGGSGADGLNIAVVDNSGNVYVAGTTNSASNISYNNPSTQNTLTGSNDGWMMSLNSGSGGVSWSRYFNSGAGLSTDILCMELNQVKNKLIIGGTTTGLASGNITTMTPNNGNGDFFVANLPVSGASTNWGTYFGGSQNEYNMMGLNVDQNDDVYALGYTFSRDIAVINNPIEDGTYNPNTGDRQAIFFKLSGTNGATVLYTTYLGGSGDDYDPVGERGLKFNNCRVYLAITSASDDFPLTAGTLTSTVPPGGIGTLEPIVMSMANPPDITGNNISSGGNQVITCGATPAPIIATTPIYVIPAIIRNTVTETNGTVNAYPDGVPAITSFQWQASYDSGQNWANIVGATGASLSFSGPIGFTGLVEYRRIINGDACNRTGDTLDVAFILNGTTHPAPTASTNAPICSGQTLTLNGNSPDTGTLTYVWNGPNGIVDSVQNVTIQNAGSADTGLWTVYTINSQHCASVRDSIYVSIGGHLSPPTASSNSPVCAGDTIKLSASGSGIVFNWTGPDGFTSTSASASIPGATVANAGVYSVTQSNANGVCLSSPSTVTVTVDTLPLVYAGPRQEQCNAGTFNLNAYPAINNGLWRIVSGTGVLSNTNQYNATLSGVPAGTKTVLQWTVTNGGCSASGNVTLKNDAPPVVANAGPEQFNCTNGTFNLIGNNPAPGTGLWTIVSGTGNILNPPSPSSEVTGVTVNDTINDTTVVQWTITSGTCPSTSSQTLLIRPSLPIAICKNITIALVNGVVIVSDSMINGGSYSGCGTLILSGQTDTFTCANVGVHQITLTVTDGLKHYDSCTATVTIIDTTAPTAICKNITVALVNGSASITASQVDGGSSASCGSATLSALPTSFNCSNIGPNSVTLTVTDQFGNVSNCTAVVTVVDNTPPAAICQNITVALSHGSASITAAQIDGGSSASCGNVTLSASPTTFNCSNIGPNSVTLTVTDAYGNTSTCTAVVTVVDTATQPEFTSTPPSIPVAVGQLFTYNIVTTDPAGATLAIGSTVLPPWLTLTDNGNGTATLTGTPGQANIGPNTVTLTVSEGSYTCSGPITQTFIINVYESDLGVGLQGINSCGMADNGAANAIVNGGTAPFTYAWLSSGNGASNVSDSTGASITGLAPGTYTVTVTDHYGITGVASVIITSTAPNITVSNDTSICVGASVQLNASGGDLYSWTPGGSLSDSTIANPVATPNITTTYTVTGYVHTGNLVYNGDFSLGNTGFTSDYTYISAIANANTPGGDQGLVPEGNYAVDTNAHNYHPAFFGHDHTTGHTNFMIVNGAPVANEIIWSQTVPNIQTNTTYYFSTWVSSLDLAGNYADLVFYINGVQLGAPILAPSDTSDWIQFYTTWNSGNNTSADISIINENIIRAGNDFGLDDISFTTACPSIAQVTVTVYPIPDPSAGPNQTVCLGQSATLTAAGNGSYLWSTGDTSASITVTPLVNTTYTVTVTNPGNCSATASATVSISNSAPTAVCQNATVILDANGSGNITGASVDGGSTASCGVASLSVSPNTFNCSNLGTNQVTLIVTDSSGNSSSCVATVTVLDTTPIRAICENITVALVNGTASIIAAQIDGGSSTGCGKVTLSASTTSFNCSNIGANNVTLTVTDGSGNVSTCTAVVTVIDTTPPTAVCQNVTVALSNGTASITAAQIDGGSSASCGSVNLSVSTTSFNCSNIGPNNVTLTVTDALGNSSTCTAVVTVIDTTPPTAVCQSITVALSNGTASITAAQIDGGSSASCGSVTLSASPTTFNCSNIGPNNVTLTVTDAYGNSSTCTTVVTVADTATQPAFTSTPLNTTVEVDQTFTYNITTTGPAGTTLVIGSTALPSWLTLTDNGNGTATLNGTPGSANIGPNTVTLTVSEGSYTCASPVTQTFIINVIAGNLGVNIQGVNTCGSSDNGAASVFVTGGTSPYKYAWSSSGNGASNVSDSTGASITGLAVGTYSVTVTDFYGLTGSATVTVSPTTPNIIVSNDTTICIGSSVQLMASGGDLYSWSPASSLNDSAIANPIATPTVTTTYTVTGYVHTGNLVVNGDFSQGNFGFTSSYNYVSPADNAASTNGDEGLYPETTYAVDTNAHNYHPNFFGHDHTTGTGKFMIVNGATTPNVPIWSETVNNILPNTTYYFSTWVSAMNTIRVYADLKFTINGTQIGPVISSPDTIDKWIQFYTTWNSGNNTSANISIVNENTVADGNDFGLDDISFTTACPSTQQVTVTVLPLPVASAGQNQTICAGRSAILTATGGGSYKWSTGDTAATIRVTPAGTTTYTVTVTNGGNCSATSSVTVSISNSVPDAVCKSVTVMLNANDNASITASSVDGGSTAACGVASLSVSPNTFNCSNLGTNHVTLTVTDSSGHTSTCSATVTVLDTTPPTAICKNITIALVGSTASITGSQINGGSSALCGSVTLSANPTAFNCSNIGPNNVTLTVTDGSGNTAQCTAVVTVIDNTPPLAVCKNVTLYLNQQGSASLAATQVDGGSTDNCTIVSRAISKTSFNCSNIGTTPVTLTVTDESGNVDSCHATVTILDTIKPEAVCKSITVTLVNGVATITASQIDGGSTDNCSIVSTTASQTTFTVANVGANTVTLTVTDASGNKSTCTATVTVVNPSISCNVTSSQSSCHSNGSVTLNVTSTGIAPFTYHWSPGTDLICTNCANPVFTPTSPGTYTFDVTVTDHNGSTTTCSITIRVTPPPISCNVTATHTSCEQNSSTTLNVTSTGVAPFAYQWSPGTDLSCNNCASPVFTPTASGTYTFDVTVTDHNGSTTTCNITITVTHPNYCTVSQGFFGSSNGKYPPTGQTALQLLSTLLATPLTVGEPGNSFTIHQLDGTCLNSNLPTGSAPQCLPSGNGVYTNHCGTSTNIPLMNGRFANVLLGQTITLGLNMRLNGSGFSNLTVTSPSSVVNKLMAVYGSATVGNLFDLANHALACESVAGTTLGDITSAEDAINQQYDNCASTCDEKSLNTSSPENLDEREPLRINVYPNPFNGQFHIKVESENISQINVRLIDLSGKLIKEIANVQSGDEMNLGSDLAAGIYLVEITQNNVTKVIRIVKQSTY